MKNNNTYNVNDLKVKIKGLKWIKEEKVIEEKIEIKNFEEETKNNTTNNKKNDDTNYLLRKIDNDVLVYWLLNEEEMKNFKIMLFDNKNILNIEVLNIDENEKVNKKINFEDIEIKKIKDNELKKTKNEIEVLKDYGIIKFVWNIKDFL